MTVHATRRDLVVDDRISSIRAWQDWIRDPSLTVLLIIQLCAIFLAMPLAAKGLPIARVVGQTLGLVALVIVVLLSHDRGAIVAILLGVFAIAASALFGRGWLPIVESVVRRGGDIITWSALIWVVVHAVYAPGRITGRRLGGAAVVYLGLALLFASAYGLIWELTTNAFANLQASPGGDLETADLMYFSLTTLTTTGYGDILPVDPFARSLANLESVLGVFYIAITVARLVTLELHERLVFHDRWDLLPRETAVVHEN
jgi:voltage-gated potassium channel Kch